MKLQWKLFISISVLLNSIFFVAFALPILDRKLNSPRRPPDIQSAFLRSYTPKKVVDSYESADWGSSWSETISGPPATRGNFNDGEINPTFAIQTAKEPLLMTALKEDVYAQLSANGGSVVSENRDPQGGFLFNYRVGTDIGVLTVSPLMPNSRVQRGSPLPDGITDVALSMKIAETPLN